MLEHIYRLIYIICYARQIYLNYLIKKIIHLIILKGKVNIHKLIWLIANLSKSGIPSVHTIYSKIISVNVYK